MKRFNTPFAMILCAIDFANLVEISLRNFGYFVSEAWRINIVKEYEDLRNKTHKREHVVEDIQYYNDINRDYHGKIIV